jgi:hypothetical protein
MAVMTNDGSPVNVLAERLNHLFGTVQPPDTAREVADAINVQARAEIISAAHLSQLQIGQGSDPSHSHLLAIAGVDTVYLCNEVDDDEAYRVALLSSVRDADVRFIALRAQGLSQASLAVVRAVIENARRLEGLDQFKML